MPAMIKDGHSIGYVAAITAQSATLSPALFAASITLGAFMAIACMAAAHWTCRKYSIPKHPRANLVQMTQALRAGAVTLGLALIILGGIFTTVEAVVVMGGQCAIWPITSAIRRIPHLRAIGRRLTTHPEPKRT